jgi:predicted GNAT superfamily acetyltransferase
VAVTWTFDPLVRRNAWLNISKLGAAVEAYLPDFYGRMDDGINDGDETDRLLAVWATAASSSGDPATADAAPVLEEVAGAPVTRQPPADAPVLAVATPPDVETLRRTDRALALQWRRAVRDALVPLLAEGRIVGFSRGGSYLVRR